MEKQDLKKPKEKVTRVSRTAAANCVVAALVPGGKTTLEALVGAADEIFVKAGGESKPSAAILAVRHVLETAASLGFVKLTKPTDVLVEKLK